MGKLMLLKIYATTILHIRYNDNYVDGFFLEKSKISTPLHVNINTCILPNGEQCSGVQHGRSHLIVNSSDRYYEYEYGKIVTTVGNFGYIIGTYTFNKNLGYDEDGTILF